MRRGLRRLGVALGVLLLAAALVLVGGWVWLHGAGGQAFVAARARAALADALPGQLDFSGLTLDGTTVTLEGLRVRTPDGEQVLAARRLSATVDLRALAEGHVLLRGLRLVGAEVELRRDERGLSLTRAFVRDAPVPAAGAKPSPGGGLWLTLEDVTLEDGAVHYQDASLDERLQGVGGTLSLDLRLPPGGGALALDAKTALKASLAAAHGAPAQPVELAGSATAHDGAAPQVDATLRVADTSAAVRVDAGGRAVTVQRASLSPAVLRRFVPAWPLEDAVALEGTASPTALALTGGVGGGTVTLRAQYALPEERVSSFDLTVKDVDPAQLTGGGAPSRLSASLTGELTGFSATSATGALALDARWTLPGGGPLGTATGTASLAGGALRVGALALSLPGGSARLTGEVTSQRVTASGQLTATDLSQLERTVERYAQVDVPALEGRGTLAVAVEGPLAAPRLRAQGRLQGVVAASAAASELHLDLTMPNLRRPLESDGELEARGLALGGSTFEVVRLKLATQGRAVDVRLVTKGIADVAVHARALVDRDGDGARLDTLDLDAPPTTWRLVAPSAVRWPKGSLTVPPTTLASGAQRLELELTRQRKQLEGVVQLRGVRLELLPRALGLADARLSGVVDGVARLHGALPRPQVVAQVTLSKGAVRGVSGLAAQVTASTSADGAGGELHLTSPLGRAQGSFDVPWALFERGTTSEAPLRASATLEAVDVAQLLAAAGKPQPLQLVAGLTASLAGTAAHPTVSLRATADALDWRLPCDREAPQDAEGYSRDTLAPLRREACVGAQPGGEQVVAHLGDVALELNQADTGGLRASLTATALGGPLSLTLETPKDVAALLAAPPAASGWAEEPFTARASAQGLDLHWLAVGWPQAAALRGGRLGWEATVHGPWQRATLEASARVERVGVGPLDELGATLRLRSLDGAVSATLDSALGAQPLLGAELSWAVPLSRLADGLDDAAALDGRVQLSPTTLAALWPVREDRPHVRGAVSGSLRVTGSLAAPTLTLGLEGAQLAWGSVPLGALQAQGTLGPTRQALKLSAGQRTADPELQVDVQAGVPLGLEALRGGLAALDGPLRVTARAREVDVGFLSGAHPAVRRVGGLVSGSAEVTGTVRAPTPRGELTWRDGRLAVAGYGDYRGVQLDVRASDAAVELRQLDVRSGAGTAHLSATATALGTGAWTLTAAGGAARFPLVVDDQLLATATLERLAVEGTVGAQLVELRRVAAEKLKVELPEVSGKKLQSLARPDDIVVLRNGRRPGKAGDAPAAGGTSVVATLELPRNVWVESSDVHLEVGLSDGFRVEAGNGTRLYGELFVMRGSVDVFGRRFEVAGKETSLSDVSKLSFAGPAKSPRIDVKATHTNDAEKVAVTAQVRAFSLDGIKLTSEPPGMTDSEIFTLLATGRRNLHRGSSASITPEQAASAIGSYVSAKARDLVAKVLPLDVFTVETSSAAIVSRIEVGKYLTDKLYVGGTIAPAANQWRGENAAAVRLEWQVSKHWALEVEGGTAPAVNADVMWTREY